MKDKVQNLSKIPKVNYLKTITIGKRFESYIGWAFSKELECKNYCLNLKYSLLNEKERLIEIMKMQKIEKDKAEEILMKVDDYIKEQAAQIQSKFKNATDTTTTTTSESDISSEGNNNLMNLKKDKNIINIEDNKKIQAELNQINKKKNKLKENDVISGDFDVVIPNVELSNFKNFLRNNFGFFIEQKKEENIEEKTERKKDKDKEPKIEENVEEKIQEKKNIDREEPKKENLEEKKNKDIEEIKEDNVEEKIEENKDRDKEEYYKTDIP